VIKEDLDQKLEVVEEIVHIVYGNAIFNNVAEIRQLVDDHKVTES